MFPVLKLFSRCERYRTKMDCVLFLTMNAVHFDETNELNQVMLVKDKALHQQDVKISIFLIAERKYYGNVRV